MVTYGPGEQVFYLEDLCPQPVSNRTYTFSTIGEPKIPGTNNYQLAVAAVSNPQFVSLEDGTTYLYSQPGSGSYSSQTNNEGTYNGNGYWFTLYFFHYSNMTYHPCGISGATAFNVTAGIEVDFYAPFFQTVNGTSGPGIWNVTAPTISAMSTNDLFLENNCIIT